MLLIVATSLPPLLLLLQLAALNGPEVVVLATATSTATSTASQPSERSGNPKQPIQSKQHGAPTTNTKGKIKQQRNNILLLLTDDQDIVLGSFDTASYMPILHDKLRNQGTTFSKGALVHVPICCPSRSSLLTGKYLHHGNLAINNSVVGNCYSDLWKSTEEDHHTLAVHAQDAGYTTLYAGKYLNRYKHHDKHTIGDGIPKGWDYWYGLEGNSRYYNYTIVERTPSDDDGGNATVLLHKHGDVYPDDYLPLVLEDYTLSTLRTLPEPWLAIIAWPTPHGPFTPEPQYANDYPEASSPRHSDYNATEDSQKQKHWLLRQLGVITNTTAASIDAIYKDRLRALKTVDNHVGKLMDWLEEEEDPQQQRGGRTNSSSDDGGVGELLAAEQQRDLTASNSSSLPSSPATAVEAMIDRTVIIYTSDNGFQFGQHRLSIDKRHLYEHDVRVPFVVRGPPTVVPANVSLPKEVIVSTIDIAPTILEIIAEGIPSAEREGRKHQQDNNATSSNTTSAVSERLDAAIQGMDGLSFWKFLKGQSEVQNNKNKNGDEPNPSSSSSETEKNSNIDDPFVQRTDLLITYHGEGNPKCGLSECPAPLDGLWWMPDSYNNTYHCVRTLRRAVLNKNSNKHENVNPSLFGRETIPADQEKDANDCRENTAESSSSSSYNTQAPEDSIYCVFYDDEDFVEFYDLTQNPHQLGNDYESLSETAIEYYEKRLQELLS